MNARKHVLSSLASLCALAGCLALASAPALASRGHVFSGSFGEKGAGPGQLSEPAGVAVNEATGDVYVVDKGNDRVEWFTLDPATKAYEYAGELNGSGLLPNEGKAAGSGGLAGEVPTGRFAEPEGIAIDNSCFLHKTPSEEAECKGSDPSAGDVYVVDTGHGVIDKFSPMGEYVGQLSEISPGLTFQGGLEGRELDGVAVDPRGEVWVYEHELRVSNFSDALANEFVGSRKMGNYPEEGIAFGKPGFAVDSGDNLYEAYEVFGEQTAYRMAKLNVSGELLKAAVDDEQSTSVAVELSTDDAYLDNVSTLARFGPNGTLIERLGAGELTASDGVGLNASSETVYATDAASDMVSVFALESPGPPTVESESVTDVSGESATLQAEVNPRGASTEADLEYGPCTTLTTCATSPYEKSTPPVSVGSEFAVAIVGPTHIQDLQPDTLYHFRLAAHNSAGTGYGERTFTTQGAGAFSLPDGRQWEMVSPPQKHGALLSGIGDQGNEGGAIQAAAEGNAISYVADTPTESEPPGYANEAQVYSARGPAGWQTHDLAVPHAVASSATISAGNEYRFFNEDLSAAFVQPFGPFDPAISEEASEQTTFLHVDYLDGNVGEPCTSSCYRPLATSATGYANVPPGSRFGEFGTRGAEGQEQGVTCPPSPICGPEFYGATPDGSHAVLASSIALTSTAIPVNRAQLYEWSGGEPAGKQLQLVSLMPNGGGPSGADAWLGAKEGEDTRNAVSSDGSRVFFSTEESQEAEIYMRDVLSEKTLRLDVPEPECLSRGTCGGGRPGSRFQTAARDGSRVFFTDTQRLTGDSGASEGKPDLYECAITDVGGEPKCKLSDLTPARSTGEAADVQSEVLGASEDGSYIYFVADSVLGNRGVPVPGAVRGSCSAGNLVPGALCNLYVRHEGRTSLAAVLSGEDAPDFQPFSGVAGLTARVSPNGQWLAFMSDRELTGSNNRDALSGHADEEVYLYDAVNGRIVCASCNPAGTSPLGEEYAEIQLFKGDRVWNSSSWLAADVPGWTPYAHDDALYQSRYLSDNGRLFFNAYGALVPTDVNGNWDVYEYEPEGVGGCASSTSSGSDVFEPARTVNSEGRGVEEGAGCVGLISAGESPDESTFLDASATGGRDGEGAEGGGDVFFLTTSKLVGQDFDDNYDLYDAHECRTISPCVPPAGEQVPPCTTEASCKPAPEPQPSIYSLPSSATFSGESNVSPAVPVVVKKTVKQAKTAKLTKALKRCRKDRAKQRRTACEQRARKQYGPVKAKQPTKGRK